MMNWFHYKQMARQWHWLERITAKRAAPGHLSEELLVQTLATGNRRARRQAIETLANYRSPSAIELLCGATKDYDWHVRSTALWALCIAIDDDLPSVREQTATTLVNLGEPAVQVLCRILEVGIAPVRQAAVEVLCRINHPHVIEPLCQVLEDDIAEVREQAKQALMQIGPPAIDRLRRVLDSHDLEARRAAAEILSGSGAHAVGPLYRALADEDVATSRVAQEALVTMGTPAIQGLCTALQNEKISRRAQTALVEIGVPAVEPLCCVIVGGNREARKRAAWALGEIGDLRAIEPLCHALSDVEIASQVQAALASFGASVFEPLCNALTHASSQVRCGAAATLARLGDARAVEPLCAALRDADWSVREQAVCALGEIPAPQAVPPLCTLLLDTSAAMRACAATSLGQIADPTALESLYPLLEDDYSQVRSCTATAIGHIGQRQSLTGLHARLHPVSGEHSISVRAALHTAIERIERSTAATQGLPRMAEMDILNPRGLPRSSETMPAPEGRPRVVPMPYSSNNTNEFETHAD